MKCNYTALGFPRYGMVLKKNLQPEHLDILHFPPTSVHSCIFPFPIPLRLHHFQVISCIPPKPELGGDLEADVSSPNVFHPKGTEMYCTCLCQDPTTPSQFSDRRTGIGNILKLSAVKSKRDVKNRRIGSTLKITLGTKPQRYAIAQRQVFLYRAKALGIEIVNKHYNKQNRSQSDPYNFLVKLGIFNILYMYLLNCTFK